MCFVSFVGTEWSKTVPEKYPWLQPNLSPQVVFPPLMAPSPSREEFDELRKEMEALRDLLIAAKEFDEAIGQPDCEMEEKVALIKRFAEFVGVDLEDVFPE